MFSSTTYQHSAPHVIADSRVVVTYIATRDSSTLGFPSGETTTLRSIVRPPVGPVTLGDIDSVSNGGFFGASLHNPSLVRRSDGTVTAAWVITDPVIASLRLSTADLGSSATLFAARDDVEGFGATSIVGATDMAQLPGAALGLVASDGTERAGRDVLERPAVRGTDRSRHRSGHAVVGAPGRRRARRPSGHLGAGRRREPASVRAAVRRHASDRVERRHSSGARRRPGRDVLGDGDGCVDRRHGGMGLRRRADRHRRAGEPLLRGGRAVLRQRPRPRRGGQPVRQDRTRRARDRAACGRRPRDRDRGARHRTRPPP